MGSKRPTILVILSLFLIALLSETLAGCQSPSPSTTATSSSSSAAKPANPTQAASIAAAPSNGTPQSGGTLKIITNLYPPVLGPLKAGFNPAQSITIFAAIETLVGMTKDGPAPTKLATSWDISPDSKSLTFHLRQGVKFHDGTEFNATAVKWNLDQLLKTRGTLQSITSIDVIDNTTVKLNLSYYDNALLNNLAWYDGLMESPTNAQGHDKAYLSSHLCGTGPFQLVSFTQDVSATFKKFDDYWDKGKPYLDGIEYNVVADPSTAQTAFQGGQAQLLDAVDPKFLKNLVASGYTVNSVPRLTQSAIGDSANPNSPFSKLQVRQALDYAVDKQAIANAFGAGTWEVPVEPCSSKLIGYIPDFKGRSYDPAKAKQLLAEAGYPQGFQTTIYYRNDLNRDMMAAIQANLKDVGITAQTQPIDSAKNASLMTQGWPENSILLRGLGVNTSYAYMLQNDGPSKNSLISASITSKYTDLLKQASAAQDSASQTKLNQQLVQLVSEEAVIVPWFIDSRNAVCTKAVHTDYATYSNQYWNPGNTWLSK
jgi:ABC-type transport system substrate-binding protein